MGKLRGVMLLGMNSAIGMTTSTPQVVAAYFW